MSSHVDQHPKWNYEEFCAFLLLYGANADMQLDEVEIEMAKAKVGEERFIKIKSEFDNSSDYDVIQIILVYKGLYFPTNDRKEELLAMIRKEFLADGKYSIMEKNLMRLLNKLM